MDRSLTEKQQAFIENFAQTGNAKQSAIKAGYSEATAEQQGHNLKKQLNIKQLQDSPLFLPKLKSLFKRFKQGCKNNE